MIELRDFFLSVLFFLKYTYKNYMLVLFVYIYKRWNRNVSVQILALKVYNFSTWVEKCRISLYAEKVRKVGKCNKIYTIIHIVGGKAMLEIGVCDDDHLLLWEMEKYLLELGCETGRSLEVTTYADGDEIVKAVMKGKRFDIIYIDIEMPGLNGMTAAKMIRELDRTVQIVFVTCHESYMKEAFMAAPIGFLVKPVSKDEFTGTFNYILKMIGAEDQYYRFRYDRSDYKVLLKEVIYFESKGRMTEIVCESGRYRLYKNLEAIEEELRGQKMRFVRTHKSYLVSYWRISRFSADIVELMDGICLPVSRSRKKEVEVNLYEAMEWCHV